MADNKKTVDKKPFYKGEVITPFSVKDKEHKLGSKYETASKVNYDYLVKTKRIK